MSTETDMYRKFGNFEFRKEIPVKPYNEFRELVGWGALPEEEAEVCIANSQLTISCWTSDEKAPGQSKMIGMSRMLWDYGYSAYLSDVIVLPEYQMKGIGREMVTRLLSELTKRLKPGWKAKVNLQAAKGKEPFYEKMGFERRPNEHSGCGMLITIKKEA